jgi:hypothetical protein
LEVKGSKLEGRNQESEIRNEREGKLAGREIGIRGGVNAFRGHEMSKN